LTYTPAANANGSSVASVQIHDDGGTVAGGVDTSAVQTFSITVNSVNDAPSFTPGTDVTVNEDSGAYSAGWATSISAGPSDESGQTVNFIVSNGNNSLFSAQPAISATGVLTFTPAADAFGSAAVSVQIHDNGGTANGGVDTSAVQTFALTVNPVNDAPSFTPGADVTVNETPAPTAPRGPRRSAKVRPTNPPRPSASSSTTVTTACSASSRRWRQMGRSRSRRRLTRLARRR